MKKLLSTGYSTGSFNFALLVLRLTTGILMCVNHGFLKVSNFSQLETTFFDPLHIGSRWSLILSISAELFASIFIALGLFTRLAAFIVVIDMAVAVLMFNHSRPVKSYEDGILFLAGFFCILLVGPGKYSVDGMTGK